MNIDSLIVGLVLIITLSIGIYYSRNITSFQEYAIGNREISSTAITVSLLVTVYNAALLHSRLNAAYREGLYILILDLSVPITFYIISRFIILRVKELMGHCSIAESMGQLYGPTVRIVSAIFFIVISIAWLATQIRVGMDIVVTFFPEIEKYTTYATIALVSLITIYTTSGGAKAVVLTDVYQFFLFSICLPILILTMLYHMKGSIIEWKRMANIPQFNLSQVFTWNDRLKNILLLFFCRSIMFHIDPARAQRFYMAASVGQAAKIFKRSAIIRSVFLILFISVAIGLHVSGHIIPSSQNVLQYIVELDYFPGLRGILVTAIIALLMGTSDSYLHISSVLFAHDLWIYKNKSFKQAYALRIARIASIMVAIISLIIALHTTDIEQLLSKVNYMFGYASVPFIMASLGFRPRSITVLLTIGLQTAIAICHIYHLSIFGLPVTYHHLYFAFFQSAFMLLLIHYLLPKRPHTGWIGIKDTTVHGTCKIK